MIRQIRRVRTLRKSLGWSQEKMAHEIGVSLATYSRWERGKCAPASSAMLKLLEGFLKKHKN
ncbi:MAG: transcriptional regulator [Chloroflexi bacterium]|nr:MAG: transcriptional regulator [Chloroflexota bacterium]